MSGRNFLFVPGPTNIPDRVQRAMVVAMEDHRSSRFPELALSVLAELKKVFKTQTGKTILFPSSGTGCWEAALQNRLNPGDRVLAASFGQFSHLWIDMCQRLEFEVQVLDTEWGEGAPVERLSAIATRVAGRSRHHLRQPEGACGSKSRYDAALLF
jgi:alanine-glyoxylate transaminase/serine-glyoxylate transaminase/serine-pyruvate transaminase